MFRDLTDAPVQEATSSKRTRGLVGILMNVNGTIFAMVVMKYARTLQEVTNATTSSVQ